MQNLFIYIPTFQLSPRGEFDIKRLEALRMQLENLEMGLLSYPTRVRLIVNDNNSPGDGIFQLSKKYEYIKNLEFRRNLGNIGGNANIANGFTLAKKK